MGFRVGNHVLAGCTFALGIFRTVWWEVLAMCLRIGKDLGLERQCMALGYGEIKDILMAGGFLPVCLLLLAPIGISDDRLCFQRGMDGLGESAHSRMHCLHDTIGITK